MFVIILCVVVWIVLGIFTVVCSVQVRVNLLWLFGLVCGSICDDKSVLRTLCLCSSRQNYVCIFPLFLLLPSFLLLFISGWQEGRDFSGSRWAGCGALRMWASVEAFFTWWVGRDEISSGCVLVAPNLHKVVSGSSTGSGKFQS
jgi:hypothetical protein